MASPPPNQISCIEPATAPTRARRAWVWFLVGFFVVFGFMLLVVKTHYMHPSGQGLVRSKLWQYYVSQIPPLFGMQELGPGTVHLQDVVTNLVQHFAFACFGGLVALGIGWTANKAFLTPKTG